MKLYTGWKVGDTLGLELLSLGKVIDYRILLFQLHVREFAKSRLTMAAINASKKALESCTN